MHTSLFFTVAILLPSLPPAVGKPSDASGSSERRGDGWAQLTGQLRLWQDTHVIVEKDGGQGMTVSFRTRKCGVVPAEGIYRPAAGQKLALMLHGGLKYQSQTSSSLWDRGLMEEDSLRAQDIFKGCHQYHEEVNHKKFTGPVLAYVTPWNGHGYDMAVQFRSKFTYISPVWYQLRQTSGVLELTGGHDVDKEWLQKLREPTTKGAAPPRIVPRFLFELGPQALGEVLVDPTDAIAIITEECRKRGYDGMVLEGWSQWLMMGANRNKELKQVIRQLVIRFSDSLHASKQRKDLILVAPPCGSGAGGPSFLVEDYKALRDAVDGFGIMTYDHSNPMAPGPNAPIDWVRSCVDQLTSAGGNTSKLMFGLNFYGNDFTHPRGGGSILGRDFVDRLSAHTPQLLWDSKAQEHSFKYKDAQGASHVVYYPTPASLNRRLELFERRGVGASIWEIGQGLECFYDLL